MAKKAPAWQTVFKLSNLKCVNYDNKTYVGMGPTLTKNHFIMRSILITLYLLISGIVVGQQSLSTQSDFKDLDADIKWFINKVNRELPCEYYVFLCKIYNTGNNKCESLNMTISYMVDTVGFIVYPLQKYKELVKLEGEVVLLHIDLNNMEKTLNFDTKTRTNDAIIYEHILPPDDMIMTPYWSYVCEYKTDTVLKTLYEDSDNVPNRFSLYRKELLEENDILRKQP